MPELSTPPAAPVAPTAAPALSQPPAAPANAGGTPPALWFPEAHKGFMETKGNPDPGAFVESYINLEKLVGADPKTILRMPKEGDAEAWGKFYGQLGRPESPDKYTPIEALKEDPLAKDFDSVFHSLGVTEKQRTGILNALLEKTAVINAAQDKKLTEDTAAAQKRRMEALTAEQGDQMAAFTEDARRAVRTAIPSEYKDPATGKVWTHDEINGAIEDALGVDLALRIFNSLGKFQAEDVSVQGTTSASGVSTPEQASARWAQLQKDAAWGKRFMDGDLEARREYERLSMIMASAKAA